MANLVSSGTADKLIKNQYLHSNTSNFVEVVSQLRLVQREQTDNELLLQIKDRLERLLNKTNDQMNAFYQDLSAYYESIGQTDKIITGRDYYHDGIYEPNGANEFSRKFLINKNMDANSTDEQIILSIINSIESRSEIIRIYNEVSQERMNTSVLFNQEQQDLIKQINNLFDQKIFPTTNSMLFNEIEGNIDKMFIHYVTKSGANRTKLSQKISKEQLGDFYKLLSQLRLEEFSMGKNSSLRNLKNKIVNSLKNRDVFYEVGNRYWDYLNGRFKTITGRSLHGAKKRKFARFFADIISGYSVNLTDVKQIKSLNGFLLEFGMYASANLPLKYTQEVVSVLGQEQVIREYITEQYSLTGQKIKGEKITTGQSPSDIEYQGLSGTVYRFQLKNDFHDVYEGLSFRSQAEIKVSTYLSTAFTNVDEDIKDILLYLLINTAFLRKYGLGRYNSGETITFQPTHYPIITDYILFFLQQSYQFLVGYQYDRKVQEVYAMTAGNLAYIFKGKYLIPVAAYFYSALEMMRHVINDIGKKDLKGVAGIAGLPGFKNDSLEISNKEFQENKINLLAKLKYNDAVYGEYKYPQGLLEYGSSYGRKLYNSLTFKRISITLLVNQLEKYFK